jgi:hypothetical protein
MRRAHLWGKDYRTPNIVLLDILGKCVGQTAILKDRLADVCCLELRKLTSWLDLFQGLIQEVHWGCPAAVRGVL